jgi:ABC-type multidrug transport system fused ATPase/permease subunit
MYVIRAFNKTEKFINKYYVRQKSFIVATVNQNITSRWINLVTDIFSIFTVGVAGYLGVLSKVIGIGSGSANVIGLALVWSLQIGAIMSFTLRVLADTESNMNAVVRLYDYIDNNPSEADFEEPKPKNSEWPTHGDYKI